MCFFVLFPILTMCNYVNEYVSAIYKSYPHKTLLSLQLLCYLKIIRQIVS